MEKTVICPSCGAEFDTSLVRCPYCGTHYEPAAEQEYMGQLETVHTELASHRGHAASKTIIALLLTILLFAAYAAGLWAIGVFLGTAEIRATQVKHQRDFEEFKATYCVTTEAEK